MTFSLPRVSLFVFAASAAFCAHAAEPAMIAKARAAVGTEATLNAVKSIRYVGTLVTADAAEPAKQTRAAVDIIFQKPDRQRISLVHEKSGERASYLETTALDSYEGWTRIEDAADKTKWKQTLLGTDAVKGLRAITWDHLGFYRDVETHGGRIEDLGPTTIEGVKCQKLAFIYSPAVIFYRHFDAMTGKLVFTETANGSTIKEQGEMIVSGIRFPKTIIQTSKDQAGRTMVLTTTLEKVTVNETFPLQLFAVPSVPAPGKK